MNKKQLIVMWVGVGLIVLMGIFPPWILFMDAFGVKMHRDVGCHFIWARPVPSFKVATIFIDIPRLFYNLALVALVTGAFAYYLKDADV